jgi:hypothetical protein
MGNDLGAFFYGLYVRRNMDVVARAARCKRERDAVSEKPPTNVLDI